MAARNAREQEDFGPEPRSIDLREYWLLIRRRWLSVLVLMIAGALLGLGYAYSTGVSYSATSQVLVSPVTQGPLNQTAQVNDLVNMSTEQAVAQSAAVVNRAAAILGVPRSTLQAAAAKRLTVAVPTTSDVLQITWEADSPHAAQSGANAFAKAYLGYRSSYLSSFVNQLNTTLNDQVVSLKGKIKSTEAQLGTASAARPSGWATVEISGAWRDWPPSRSGLPSGGSTASVGTPSLRSSCAGSRSRSSKASRTQARNTPSSRPRMRPIAMITGRPIPEGESGSALGISVPPLVL